MEFRFKIQQYQTDAVKAVVDVFEGQPFIDNFTYIRDQGPEKQFEAIESGLGYGNAGIALTEDELLENIKNIQRNSNIPLSTKLDKSIGNASIDVEMETGTGKTYVYIKTMFELNKRYGWSKFIVVVPSIAIREGVKKSFDMTVEHFMEYYHKKARYFVYNSDNLTQIETFSSSAELSVMIINTQAFNTSMKEGLNKEAARKIYSERDDFGSRRPIDVIKANNPILILDEPQKMGGPKTTNALRTEFNPLFSINYSATHKERHNTVYVLDALDAYNQKLVKKIEVKGFDVINLTGTSGYLYLQGIVLSPKEPPKARIEFEVSQKSGIKRVTRLFTEGDSIYDESGRLGQYRDGYKITSINPFDDSITLLNDTVIHAGGAVGDISDEDIRRIQIRETIISHFDKEERLFNKGIKTLSLFFIDKVEHYRKYDDDGNEFLGDYGKIFEEEYAAELENRLTMFTDNPYQKYLREKCSDKHIVHNGYFSIDKKGRSIDSEVKRGNDSSDDITAYDLILKNKERLLSFEEPTRFIFSHSALREGWDNPNIFQICTLKHSDNKLAQRQEVGRGLRISVDKDGNRMDKETLGSGVFDINKLTVIASESYSTFVSSLQSEMSSDLAERPRYANIEYYTGKVVTLSDGGTHTISKGEANVIYFYLVQNYYIDTDGNLTKKAKDDIANGTVAPMPEAIKYIDNEIIKLTQALFDPSVLDGMIGNGRKTPIKENPLNDNFDKKAFQELWNSINDRYVYEVSFNSDELIEKAVKELDEKLMVRRLKYVIRTGMQNDEISYDDALANSTFSVTREESKNLKISSSSGKYDLVGDIARKTSLTRKTVVEILRRINFKTFEKFRLNPEDFILNASNLINEQKATMVIEHITYIPTGEKYDASTFTASDEIKDFFKAVKCKKSVQDYVFPDGISDDCVEKKFINDLEVASEVEVYAKLPKKFKIPTPVGNYSPDWAVAFKEGAAKHIYFVAETKGSMNSLDLRGAEKVKLACAKLLFNKINTSDVRYYPVTSYRMLLNYLEED